VNRLASTTVTVAGLTFMLATLVLVVTMSFVTRPWPVLVTVTVVLPLARTKVLLPRLTHLR